MVLVVFFVSKREEAGFKGGMTAKVMHGICLYLNITQKRQACSLACLLSVLGHRCPNIHGSMIARQSSSTILMLTLPAVQRQGS